jgi:4-hydroxybenzoyl-CoA reductase subunit alpha
MASKPYKTIGTPVRRIDGRSKVTGLTKFADDLAMPRMLFCKLLRSPVPHARIKSIDASAALAKPGVHAVLTGKEFPIPFGILPVSQDEHALCTDRVRFVGDPVAAVAAIDEDTAFDALDLIKVEYEALAEIDSIETALNTAEPRIHDYGDEGNIHKKVALEFGDVEEAFGSSEHVREDTFFYEGNTHLPMEQHAALAHFDADGKLTIWSSTQTPHYLHRALAKVLAPLPASHIRVIATPNGGGFGGKSDPFNHEIVLCKLAMVTGRPVKICLTREEVFYCHRGRHPVLMKVKTGYRKDGSITAMHFRSILDGGGYGSYGVASTYYTGALQTVTYQVPKYMFDGVRVFTNKPPCGPKRGHGTPQPGSRSKSRSTRSRSSSGSIPRSCDSRRSSPRTRSPRTTFASGAWASARASRRSSRARDGRSGAARWGPARGSASPAARTSAARDFRSTGTTCRTRACS